MRLDLVRHGDTGRSGYLDGRSDYPTTPSGMTQIDKQLERGGWQIVITSPLQRARRSAEAFAATTACSLTIDADWIELDFGRWEGRRRADIAADPLAREQLATFYDDPWRQSPPDGERWPDFEQRVRRGLARACDHATGRSTLVISHAGPMRMVLSIVLGIPLRSLWAIRLDYATRVGLEVGQSSDGEFWGELVELVPP
ncbi:MAG: histidine phosphatase family protein [Hyphomicrobiaceae bacterium]